MAILDFILALLENPRGALHDLRIAGIFFLDLFIGVVVWVLAFMTLAVVLNRVGTEDEARSLGLLFAVVAIAIAVAAVVVFERFRRRL